MYQFTWDRRRSDERSGSEPTHKCSARAEIGRTPDGTKIGFCGTCNYIVYWR